ncbi:2,3-bisphosphoglycerate-dependent phosphoglycerate mutase [Alphaproteobacteria bacterium]|nr:2,3-bisphosphoglycerate-dependent phosphoglycerate mutase [Alphaproteobacteria bacterium]
MNNLILLRHGQSQWNLENRFTGWEDVSLTDLGVNEAINAGAILLKHNLNIDMIFSSVLKRANQTAELAIKKMNISNLWDKNNLIMTRDKSLNERDYGELVGLNKQETAKKYGKKQVHLWRRSYDIKPPGGESLEDVVNRVKPFFTNFIEPQILSDKDILVVAHGNSLRATMIQIGLYKPEEISTIELLTGIPFLVRFDAGKVINSEFLS